MELGKYLKAIENCPDNDLANEFGIYDNFRILLKAEFEKIIPCLKREGEDKYLLKDTYHDRQGNKRAYFDYVPGALNIKIMNSVYVFTNEGMFTSVPWEDYETTIIIHGEMREKISRLNPKRAVALAVNDLSEYIQKEKVPTCFPDSKGWKHLKDNSRIVYFKP